MIRILFFIVSEKICHQYLDYWKIHLLFWLQLEIEICSGLKNTATHNPTQFYTFTADQKNTDSKTSFYLENRYTRDDTMKRLEFLFHEHICKTRPEMREKICELLLESDANGFTFDSSSRPSKCKHATYTIQLLTLTKSEQSKLWIFSCPPVHYTDLESGEKKVLPFIYKFSNARTYDSAIMYVQKDSNSKHVYPQKYIQNIDFENLRRHSFRPPSESEMKEDEINGSYGASKRITSPYMKFKRFHFSLNICSLRRAHRIYLCQQGLKEGLRKAFFTCDFFGYEETSCRKYEFQFMSNGFRDDLHVFRCPPLQIEYTFSHLRSIFLFYVASNLSYNSITLFARDNDIKRQDPRRIVSTKELQMRPIFEHIHRERFLPELWLEKNRGNILPSKPYQEIEDEINSSSGEVRMPLTLKRSIQPKLEMQEFAADNILQFTRNRWLGDRVLISFSEVKTTKLIYRRFTLTHTSIDVCHLTNLQRMLICDTALKDLNRKKYTIAMTSFSTCMRRKVTLTALEADDSETNQFSMQECPYNERHENLYFVGKNHLRDSATIYKRIEMAGLEYYYPHTLVTKIDRYKLIEAQLLRIFTNFQTEIDILSWEPNPCHWHLEAPKLPFFPSQWQFYFVDLAYTYMRKSIGIKVQVV